MLSAIQMLVQNEVMINTTANLTNAGLSMKMINIATDSLSISKEILKETKDKVDIEILKKVLLTQEQILVELQKLNQNFSNISA